MKTTTKTLLAALTTLLLVFAVSGCSDDDENEIMSPANMGEGAKLRIVHASPDAPAVDIYAEGVDAPLAANVSYTQTTDYLDIEPGDYNIQLRAAGASNTSPIAFETGMLTVPEGAKITAAAVGLLGSMDDADKFRVMVLAEGFADPGSGMAAVRIVHGAADAPAVAIDVANDGDPEIVDFARFAETGASGVALPAGTPLNVGIWAGAPLARVTAFTTPSLPEGELFLFATGRLSSLPRAEDGFGLLAVGAGGTIGLIRQDPVVYVLHTSPDAPAVDVYVGGTDTELVDNLSFGELSPPVQVPPAAYSLDVRVWDDGGTAATVMTPELMAGERYLAVASGYVGNSDGEPFQLLAYQEMFDEMGPLVRVLHASPDAPMVDVGAWDGTTFTPVGAFSGLGFGDASGAEGVALAGSLTIGVAAAGTSAPVATFDLSLAGDLRALTVAAGSLAAGGESFRLLVVDAGMWPWQVGEVMPNQESGLAAGDRLSGGGVPDYTIER